MTNDELREKARQAVVDTEGFQGRFGRHKYADAASDVWEPYVIPEADRALVAHACRALAEGLDEDARRRLIEIATQLESRAGD